MHALNAEVYGSCLLYISPGRNQSFVFLKLKIVAFNYPAEKDKSQASRRLTALRIIVFRHITRNMSQKGLVFNYIFNTAVITYLAACKHTSGLDNPERKVGTEIPVYLS